jgi:hypothetical protein
MDRKEEELKLRKAELENLKGTVEFSKAVKEDKWELAAPEGEGLSVPSANEDMLNHLPEELLEDTIAMTVEDPEEESQTALEDAEEERKNAVLSSFINTRRLYKRQ